MRPLFNFPLMLAMVCCPSCSKTIGNEEDCLDPSYKVPLEVTVCLDDSFIPYKTIDSISVTRNSSSLPYLKYFVAAYPSNPGLRHEVFSSVSGRVPVSLHPGKYTLVGWVSYESGIDNRCVNFYTDDFEEMLLKNKYSYSGADPFKLAFRGVNERNIAYNDSSTSIEVSPAMALYRLEATDSASFNPAKVIVRYPKSLPAAINARTGEINWWWSDISYSSQIKGNLLASDYVYSQNSETSVVVTVEIYDERNSLCARKENLEIPLINGGITTVRGNFYSIKELEDNTSSGNGISINTKWDASFDIEI